MNSRKTPDELAHALTQFTGTEHYYRYWGGLSFLTDGVRFVADEAHCFWLLDAIASYQQQLARHPDERLQFLQFLQFWRLRVNTDKTAVLTCVADSDEPPVVTQQIEMTDFPLPEIQIWVGIEGERKIALLPSEY
jgi:hypothetical protein